MRAGRRPVPRTASAPIPRRRKLVYALAVTIAVLAATELGGHAFAAATGNSRFCHHAALIDAIGFPQFNEFVAPDQDLFWRLVPGVTGAELQGAIGDSGPLAFTVETDADGRRSLPAAPAAAHTVLFLGDSCTFGFGVDGEETFAALLQQRLPATRCTNAGGSGNGSSSLSTSRPSCSGPRPARARSSAPPAADHDGR
ncbi:MAG: hypothetical protein FJ265_20820 [Planctomycetes bacterium]|nr:hypothetical protein [Planctomycetota bacterium]